MIYKVNKLCLCSSKLEKYFHSVRQRIAYDALISQLKDQTETIAIGIIYDGVISDKVIYLFFNEKHL